MLKIYCPKCGGLNTYVSEKPNFCQKCGGPLSASAAKTKASTKQEELQIEDEDEEQAQYDFNLDGLEFDFEPGQAGGETLGSLMGSMSEDEAKQLNSNLPKSPEVKYTAEDFRAEAGNSRDGGGNEAGST